MNIPLPISHLLRHDLQISFQRDATRTALYALRTHGTIAAMKEAGMQNVYPIYYWALFYVHVGGWGGWMWETAITSLGIGHDGSKWSCKVEEGCGCPRYGSCNTSCGDAQSLECTSQGSALILIWRRQFVDQATGVTPTAALQCVGMHACTMDTAHSGLRMHAHKAQKQVISFIILSPCKWTWICFEWSHEDTSFCTADCVLKDDVHKDPVRFFFN